MPAHGGRRGRPRGRAALPVRFVARVTVERASRRPLAPRTSRRPSHTWTCTAAACAPPCAVGSCERRTHELQYTTHGRAEAGVSAGRRSTARHPHHTHSCRCSRGALLPRSCQLSRRTLCALSARPQPYSYGAHANRSATRLTGRREGRPPSRGNVPAATPRFAALALTTSASSHARLRCRCRAGRRHRCHARRSRGRARRSRRRPPARGTTSRTMPRRVHGGTMTS